MDTREKIVSREGLHAILEEHRRAGRKIVFANGVFDLLHVGHVRYLQAARAEGDLLVVGINSDASTRKLKGDGRPILTERARATLVAALRAVDYVVIFDELDVNSLLRELQPDVHAKGTDYTADTVPNANSPRCSAFASPSSAIPSNIPRAICWRAYAANTTTGTVIKAMADQRFLLVRLGSLGDVIHALPAASALRETFPEARIDWAIDPKWQRLLEGNPDLNEIIPVDRKSAAGIASTVSKLRAAQYTCAIDFQALYKSALLAFASGAPRRIGFQSSYAREALASLLYTDQLNPRGGHKVDHNLTLGASSGRTPHQATFSVANNARGRRPRDPGTRAPQHCRILRAKSRRRLALEMLASRALRRTAPPARRAIRLARNRQLRSRRGELGARSRIRCWYYSSGSNSARPWPSYGPSAPLEIRRLGGHWPVASCRRAGLANRRPLWPH